MKNHLKSQRLRSRIRIFILDSLDTVSVIQCLLAETPECELYSCSDLENASLRISQTRPDVLLVDHDFAQQRSLELVRQAKCELPECYVIVSARDLGHD